MELSPSFSAEKQKAIDRLRYYSDYSVVRVSLQSRKKFWNKQGLTGDAYGDLAIGNVLDISLGQLNIAS